MYKFLMETNLYINDPLKSASVLGRIQTELLSENFFGDTVVLKEATMKKVGQLKLKFEFEAESPNYAENRADLIVDLLLKLVQDMKEAEQIYNGTNILAIA